MNLVFPAVLLSFVLVLVYAGQPTAADGNEMKAKFETGLTGAAERPTPVVTQASGTIALSLKVEGDEVKLEFVLTVCNIQNAAAAHIHASAGPDGVALPRLFLYSGPAFTTSGCAILSSGKFKGGQLEAALQGITLDAFLAALLSGNAYSNVHTTANPGGEIRGQHEASKLKAEFTTQLAGSQEVPPVDTDASGTLQLELKIKGDKMKLEFELVVCDIDNVLAAHIHASAAPGVNAPFRLFLYGPGAPIVSTTGCATLSSGEFTKEELQSSLIGISLDAFVDALLTGNAYVNVHTEAHPGGEIRGQLVVS